MNMSQAFIALLALALCFGIGRLLFGVMRMPESARPKAWRLAALLLLQCASAALLYFSLFPPARLAPAQNLVVLTAHGKATDAEAGNGRIIALPEAPSQAGVERVPDLASALRRHPGVKAVYIIGDGLPARDLEAARGVSVQFKPTALAEGLLDLRWPERLSPGMRWRLQGRVNRPGPVLVELVDPANAVVDSMPIKARAGQDLNRGQVANDAQGDFVLSDSVRGAGQAVYRIRVLDARRNILDALDIPLLVEAPKPLRMLMLSGGPNPELKYIRRWASDVGIQLESRIELGQGMQIQTGNAGLSTASLRELDLLMLDERAWNGLSAGSRRMVVDALNGGLGVLLRLTGPLTGSAGSELRALGFAVQETAGVQGVRLAEPQGKALLPELSRRPLKVQSPDGVVLLRTDKDQPLAIWRAQGQGRIALWWLTDTYRLALSGASSRHSQLWSEAAAAVARARDNPQPHGRQQHVWVDQRSVFCGLPDKTVVREPDGRFSELLIESKGANIGCTAFWPRLPGWHVLNGGAGTLPFFVRGRDEAPGLKANAVREGTLALLGGRSVAGTRAQIPVPGLHWPYFLAWLLVTALLWALERSRLGLRT